MPTHIGPTQRELIARRIRSMQRFLIGTSLIGVAAFTTLAAWHTEIEIQRRGAGHHDAGRAAELDCDRSGDDDLAAKHCSSRSGNSNVAAALLR